MGKAHWLDFWGEKPWTVKVDLLKAWRRNRAKKRGTEQEHRDRQRAIYRGQALKLQGRADEQIRE